MSATKEDFFLYRVAKDLWERWGEDGLRRSVVFLPSSRSKLFFVRYLYQLAGNQALVLPRWGSVCTEAERISGLDVVDPLLLLPEVFRLYRKYAAIPEEGELAEAFDEFYPAGMTILRDFDQIDKYLVNAQELFDNVRADTEITRSIEYLTDTQREWLEKFFTKVGNKSHSTLEARYLQIWQVLKPIYSELQTYIDEHKEGYEGAVLRKALERIKDSSVSILNEQIEHYAVVGFNALEACEVQYFQYLKDAAGAENVLFYWDYPESMRRAEKSPNTFLRKDAGYFIRNHRALGDALPEAEPANTEQTVEIIAAPSVLTQVDVIRELLQKQQKNDIENSVLVLPDEQLLMPILQALPKELDLNITMGYPLRNTLVYLLLENLLSWFASRNEEAKNSSRKELKVLLQHPFWQQWEEIKHALGVVDAQSDEKIADNELSTTTLIRWIKNFEELTLGDFLLELLHELGERLEASSEKEVKEGIEHSIWINYLVAAYEVIAELNQVLLRANIHPTIRLYRLLLPQLFRDKKIFYYGEPLSGLQIMGFLETRCLDFEEVTILSCNEGTLPAVHATPSFIMSSLAKEYNLPSLRDREIMYAYYFQTIMARAKHVRLIYAKTDGAGGGVEPSRYVLQQKYPLEIGISSLKILDYSFASASSSTETHSPQPVPIKNCKDEFEAYCAQGISPSALSSYCRCPLLFFYKYIARIEERQEEERAEMSPLTFGTWIHNSLQELYTPLVGKVVSAEDLTNLSSKVSSTVCDQYIQLRNHSILNGIEQIECKIVTKILYDCLERDKTRTPFMLCSLEHEVKGELPLQDGRKVRLQGKTDRIDKIGKSFYIIDYKTGQYKDNHAKFTTVAALFDGSSERDYVFQTFFYAYLLELAHYEVQSDILTPEHAFPALWFVMEGQKAEIELIYDKKKKSEHSIHNQGEINAPTAQEDSPKSYANYAEDFAVALRDSLASLVDTTTFLPTTEKKRCEKCAYQILCWGAKGCDNLT